MPVTGSLVVRGTCSVGGSGSSPSPSGHPRLDVGDVARRARPRQRGATRMPTRDRVGARRSRPRAASRCRRRRAGSSANANGLVEVVLARRAACATHVHACTVPRRPDLDPVTSSARPARWSSGRTRSAAPAPDRRRAARRRSAVAQPGEEPPDHRARPSACSRPGTRARAARSSGSAMQLPVSCAGPPSGQIARSDRGRGLPSTGRAACASTACRWARAAARR